MDATKPLAGLSILVIEDDYYLADDARRALEAAGATVLGPFGGAEEALVYADPTLLQCAIVDLNLGQGPDFAAARTLTARGIPVVLVTGYDHEIVPADLSRARWLPKPASSRALVKEIIKACGR